MNLIQYVASYGDLMPPEEPETKRSSTTQKNKVRYNLWVIAIKKKHSQKTNFNVFYFFIILTGRGSQQADISNLAASWERAADAAGPDEWSYGGVWRAAGALPTTKRYRPPSVKENLPNYALLYFWY